MVVSVRRTQPIARRFHLVHNLNPVVTIVNDVNILVRTSSIPPTDSSGGRGLGGTTAAITWQGYWSVTLSDIDGIFVGF
jgi:hypothetical protein